MRWVLLALLIAPAAGAYDVSFSTPATMIEGGSVTAPGDWLVRPLDGEELEVRGTITSRVTVDTWILESTDPVDVPVVLREEQVEDDTRAPATLLVEATADAALHLTASSGMASVDAFRVDGVLDAAGQGRAVARGDDTPYPQFRDSYWGRAGDVVAVGNGVALARCCDEGVRVEVFGFAGSLDVAGTEQEIRTGWEEKTPLTSGQELWHVRHEVFTFRDPEFTFHSSGAYAAALVDPAISWNGTAYLPLASGNLEGTILPNGTWVIQGATSFDNLHGEGGKVRANAVPSENATLMIDGKPVKAAPDLGPVYAATTATLLTALVAKLVYASALFTRLPAEEALKHPRRKALAEYVKENPGATFRELVRAVEVPAGTCRHHLSVLARSEVIVEHRHKSTVRFFENHGKFDTTWEHVVMLREPELAQLHAFIEDNPGKMQKQILDHAAQAWGWSRSTTQHRLLRLVDGGVLQIHQIGRRKCYHKAAVRQRPSGMYGRPAG